MDSGGPRAYVAGSIEAIPPGDAPPKQIEPRSSQRTNLFVAAILCSEEGSYPVKVRNLSECGGLIEAATLFPAGTAVRLCRGSLAVSGKVVWQRAGRAGLRFASTITVAEWLPANHNRHQTRVDELVRHVRAGRADGPDPATSQADSKAYSVPHQVDAIASTIERLAEELATDPGIIANHSWKLQQLEMTVQQLRKIIATGFLKV